MVMSISSAFTMLGILQIAKLFSLSNGKGTRIRFSNPLDDEMELAHQRSKSDSHNLQMQLAQSNRSQILAIDQHMVHAKPSASSIILSSVVEDAVETATGKRRRAASRAMIWSASGRPSYTYPLARPRRAGHNLYQEIGGLA